MPTDKTTELTVEACLAELREMFPTGWIQIAQVINTHGHSYFEFSGSSKEQWTPQISNDALDGLMAQVRDWKAKQ